MSRIDGAAIERIVANTIVETARGDPDALASRIVAALAEAGYRIAAVNLAKDTALGRQPFEELTPEMRPQDTYGDGRDWTFRTGEHGGDEPDIGINPVLAFRPVTAAAEPGAVAASAPWSEMNERPCASQVARQ